jgi:hypothetical protein
MGAVSDKSDADFAAQAPLHGALAARCLQTRYEQLELVGDLDTVDEQPGTQVGDVGDQAFARQRLGIRSEFANPIDDMALRSTSFLQHDGSCPGISRR